MPKFETLFSKYDRLVLFDTETTGLLYNRDEIIEFAAVVLERVDGTPKVVQEYDQLVALSPGGFVPPKIQELTGISTQDLRERGLPKTRVCRDIAEMIQGNTLLLAYNAHFDLSFLFYMLLRDGDPAVLKGKDKLDLLTVYRDRHSYPHRLCSAIEVYGLSGKVVNSHRAVDDVLATVAVMEEMEKEKNDLGRYVNLLATTPNTASRASPSAPLLISPSPITPSSRCTRRSTPMEWLNVFGLVMAAVIMIPNILFAMKCKDGFVNKWNNKSVETVEQIGRFGCFGFMIINIPGTWFGWWSDEAFAVYLVVDAVLVTLYCVIWAVCFRKSSVFRALALSIIPSVLFLFSGIMSRSILLTIAAVLFAPSHILISYQNAK